MAINPAHLTREQFGDLITEHRGWFIFEGIAFVMHPGASFAASPLDASAVTLAESLGRPPPIGMSL